MATFWQDQKTAEEICVDYGINNVELEYDDEDFTSLTTFKLYTANIRPLIAAENVDVPVSKLMKLVGAKWREFLQINPNRPAKAPKVPPPATHHAEGKTGFYSAMSFSLLKYVNKSVIVKMLHDI